MSSVALLSRPSKTLCLVSCLFKTSPLPNTQSDLIGQLTHIWGSATHRAQ